MTYWDDLLTARGRINCLALDNNYNNASTVFLNLRATSRLMTRCNGRRQSNRHVLAKGPATTCFGDTTDDVLFYYEIFKSVL